MKSVDYKRKLIKCLEDKFPLDEYFYVKIKRFHYKDDWANRNGVSFSRNGRIVSFGISHYNDMKKRECLIFSWESNHPMIGIACGELLRMQTKYNN